MTADLRRVIRIYLNVFLFEEFASVCERSTDFHFPSFEQQLSSIEDCLQQANQDRAAHSNGVDVQSTASKHSDASIEVSVSHLHRCVTLELSLLGTESLFGR
jgi:hypothetical protein